MDAKQEKRNAHWTKQSQQYSEKWRVPNAEGQLYKELEANLLVEFTNAKKGTMILELCSGTGRNSLALARTGAHVWGIDGATGMIHQAELNAAEERVDNVKFEVGDARQLPFDDCHFDAVVGTRFMYMMDYEDKRQIISEARRVVVLGGVVVLHFNAGFWGIKHEILNLLHGRCPRIKDRYLWPGQARQLFEGLEIEHLVGVKLPRLAVVSRLLGRDLALKANQAARWPFFRYLCGYLLVVARKI